MRTLSTLSLATILLFAGMTLLSPASQASNCFCGPGGVTPTAMAFGNTCSEAQSNLVAQLQPYVDCGDNAECGITVIYDVACFGAKIGVYSKGRLNYKCEICF